MLADMVACDTDYATTVVFPDKGVLLGKQLKKINEMLKGLPPDMQLVIFGDWFNLGVDFRKELFEESSGPLPVGIPAKAARAYLEYAFQMTECLPLSSEYVWMSSLSRDDDESLLQRLKILCANRVEWYLGNPRIGDIGPEKPLYGCVYPDIRHNFANKRYHEHAVSGGTTHVAIGFVDLSFLTSINLVALEKGPLKFVGYELSAFAVAKTLVIWRILQQGEYKESVHTSVLQIWYSCTWDKQTLQLFQATAAQLAVQSGLHYGVVGLLRHWSKSESVPSIATARAYRLERLSTTSPYVGNLSRKEDRLEMARYEMTGDVGVHVPYCGSVTTFSRHHEAPPSFGDESIFDAVDLATILSHTQIPVVSSA